MEDPTPRIGLRCSRPLRARRRWTVTVAVVATLALWPQPARTQVHPFYRDALRAGAAAYDQGDLDTAAEQFRIASFGMLDEPPELAETLTRLALVQAAAGHRDQFLATFERISRAEDLFNAYSNSPIAPTLRTQFEEQVTRLVPPSTLEGSAFAKLYRQQELLRLENMLPGARQAALEQLVAEHPDDPSWQLMLVSARVHGGSGGEAVAALEDLVAGRPGSQRLACLLGRAYLQSGQCEAALQAPLETIHRCDVRTLPTEELVQYIDCLSASERWLEAASVVVSLAPERRASRPFTRLEKRVAKRIEPEVEISMLPPFELEPEPEIAAPPASARQPASEQVVPKSVSTPLILPTLPAAKLARLRRQMSEAGTAQQLQAVATAAVELNRQHPHAGPEAMALAGEAAYRASKWQLAADYLQAAGGPPDDRHDLLFYLSVSLHELGDADGARQAMRRALPGLESTALVERYRREILGSIQ